MPRPRLSRPQQRGAASPAAPWRLAQSFVKGLIAHAMSDHVDGSRPNLVCEEAKELDELRRSGFRALLVSPVRQRPSRGRSAVEHARQAEIRGELSRPSNSVFERHSISVDEHHDFVVRSSFDKRADLSAKLGTGTRLNTTQ